MKIESHSHCRAALGYHFVFVTKWRKRILRGKVEMALKRVLSEVSVQAGFRLNLAGVDCDHIHVFVEAPPETSPSEIARRLKGASSRRMRQIFPWISLKMPGGALWSPSYFVASVGAISEGAVRRYIAGQGS
jgi:putative transposase